MLDEIAKRGWSWSASSLFPDVCNGNAVSFRVENLQGMDPMIVGGVGTVTGGLKNWCWPSQGKTFAEAICRAFLTACAAVKEAK